MGWRLLVWLRTVMGKSMMMLPRSSQLMRRQAALVSQAVVDLLRGCEALLRWMLGPCVHEGSLVRLMKGIPVCV